MRKILFFAFRNLRILKDLIFKLYQFFKTDLFNYEHLGHIAVEGNGIENSASPRLAGVYTTGLFSSNLLEEKWHISTNKESNIDTSVPVYSESSTLEGNFQQYEEPPLVNDPLNSDFEKNKSLTLDSESSLESSSTEEVEKEFTEEPILWEENSSTFEEDFSTNNIDLEDLPSQEEVEQDELIQATLKAKKKKKKKKSKKSTPELETSSFESDETNDTDVINEGNPVFDNFSMWLQHQSPLTGSALKKKRKKKKKKPSQVEISAKESITKNNEIVSETLATILTSQGHFDQAIGMYKKLIHLHPEKQEYFNDKIDELEKKK